MTQALPAQFLSVGHPVLARTGAGGAAANSDLASRWQVACEADPLAAARALSGNFAIGLRLADGRAWLAVDRFASRSLCYRVVDGQIWFAERALDLTGAGAEVDPQAIYDYLYFHVVPSPRTVFHGVRRLPPGHCLHFMNGQVQVTRYWDMVFSEPGSGSLAALGPQFLGLVEQAVVRQLDGSKPACFLSGGTDSSTVAGMLAKVCDRQPSGYSIGFEAEGYDEMSYARLAARHFKVDHHEYYVTPADLVRSIPQVAAHYDQPFGNSSALPAYYCARLAQQDGVTRILAGDGGDELFGGNERYAKQRIFGIYGQVPAVLRHTLLEPALLGSPLGRLPLLRKAASYIAQAKVPLPDRMNTYNLLLRMGLQNVFEPGFLARVDTADVDRQQRDVWREAQAPGDLNRMLAYDWRYTLAEADLPKVVGTTGLAGLSVGFPLLDGALTDFSMALPNAFKLKGLRLRWFFKEALRGFLPDEILTKPKHGFGLPFGVWLCRNDALHNLSKDALGALSTRGIVRPEFLRNLMSQRLQEHPGYYGEMVWIMIMLEHWLQAHAPGFSLPRS